MTHKELHHIVSELEGVDLASLVEYQKEAVVSRTIVEREDRTITVFAFDAGQALSEHIAPFHAFVQVLDGEAELTIGGETQAVEPGRFVTMPADVPHAVRAAKRFKMLLIMLRPKK